MSTARKAPGYTPAMPYVLLACAIAFEVTATLAMRASEGMSRLGPSVLVVAGYLISFVFMAKALTSLNVGPVYAIWSALGTIGAFAGGGAGRAGDRPPGAGPPRVLLPQGEHQPGQRGGVVHDADREEHVRDQVDRRHDVDHRDDHRDDLAGGRPVVRLRAPGGRAEAAAPAQPQDPGDEEHGAGGHRDGTGEGEVDAADASVGGQGGGAARDEQDHSEPGHRAPPGGVVSGIAAQARSIRPAGRAQPGSVGRARPGAQAGSAKVVTRCCSSWPPSSSDGVQPDSARNSRFRCAWS
jgi:multidrug transporter EmrE-like cation transporter